MHQIYNQFGLSETIFDGTADEKTMLNYYNRTIDPILTAIVEEYQRKFLSDTAVTQGQAIRYFRRPFKLTPMENLAEMADKFTRNEIMTKNEFRSVLGMKPSDDPKADELMNSNNVTYSDGDLQNEQEMLEDEDQDMETEEGDVGTEEESGGVSEEELLERIKKLGGSQ